MRVRRGNRWLLRQHSIGSGGVTFGVGASTASGCPLADLLSSAQLIGPEVAALAAGSADKSGRQALATYVDQAWSHGVETSVANAVEVAVHVTRLMERCAAVRRWRCSPPCSVTLSSIFKDRSHLTSHQSYSRSTPSA